MDALSIFGLQFVLSVIVFGLLAKCYLLPRLESKPLPVALTVLLLPHTIRHIGLTFMVPGRVDTALPVSFSVPAAYGDLVSGLLALLAAVNLRRSWGLPLPMVWLSTLSAQRIWFSFALTKAHAVLYLGATWFTPTFLVPILLVTLGLVFVCLLKPYRLSKAPQFIA